MKPELSTWDEVTTDNQVRPHSGFATGVVHMRDAGDLTPEAGRDLLLAQPPEWMNHPGRNCATPEGKTWWEGPGYLFDADEHDRRSVSRKQAAAMCEGCPVIAACLSDALRHEGTVTSRNRYGVRGGLNPKGREQLSRSNGWTPRQGNAEVCANGHRRTPENTWENTNGRLRCKDCHRESQQRNAA